MAQASSVTVLEAGRLVGRSKSHIFRCIKSGTISADRDAAGGYRIDRSELARVFQLARQDAPDDLPRRGDGADGAAMAQLEARLADAQDQILDLRRRLDSETDERRRLTAILADQRGSNGATLPPKLPAPAGPRRWWRWGR